MKIKSYIKLSLCLGALLILINACTKEEDFGVGIKLDYKGTVKDKIDTDPQYSFFKQLYQYHDSLYQATKPAVITPTTRVPTMAGTLGSTFITAFIPTNDAFIANGITFIQKNGGLNIALNKFITFDNRTQPTFAALTKYIGNHVINRPLNGNADFESVTRFRTLGGAANDSLLLSKINTDYFLNSKAKVNLESVVKALNGNLYPINNLVSPSFNGQFIQASAADTTLSLFSQALVRANTPAEPLINGSANTTSIYATVLAPTNQAFRDAGFTSASINALPLATLRLLIQNHITRQRIFTPQFVSGSLNMINSRPVTVTVGTAVTFTSPLTPLPANIVQSDILCTRGVIHKIDKVLRP